MNPIRAFLLLIPLSGLIASGAGFRPNPGDHIAIVGGAMADRMQHSGHFETLLQDRFPDHRLVVRNLAAAGDEVANRHRSENFGSPDDWLRRVKADVVFAFFGYNESFQGAEGLPKFRKDLDDWVKHVRATDYSGRGAARVVLFSPIANERHPNTDFPDLSGNNPALRAYTAAIEQVAKENGVPFVDAFNPSLELSASLKKAGRSLTIDGFLTSDDGDRALAPVLFEGLIGEKPPAGDMEKLRAAVNEKNWQWHQRYRTMDGYNVYGKPVRADKLSKQVNLLSGFGYRIHPVYKVPRMHYGLDFTAPKGTSIQATGDGVVKKAEYHSGYGKCVIISHGYGYETLYAHMSSFEVRAGQRVKRGQQLGKVGSTGTSTAPHCHYEVHLKGKQVNPVHFVMDGLSPREYQSLVKAAEGANQSMD